jgi:hypothetical protein
MPFGEVLHEILERITNATADGEVPEQTPGHKETSHQPRFSLVDSIAK